MSNLPKRVKVALVGPSGRDQADAFVKEQELFADTDGGRRWFADSLEQIRREMTKCTPYSWGGTALGPRERLRLRRLRDKYIRLLELAVLCLKDDPEPDQKTAEVAQDFLKRVMHAFEFARDHYGRDMKDVALPLIRQLEAISKGRRSGPMGFIPALALFTLIALIPSTSLLQ